MSRLLASLRTCLLTVVLAATVAAVAPSVASAAGGPTFERRDSATGKRFLCKYLSITEMMCAEPEANFRWYKCVVNTMTLKWDCFPDDFGPPGGTGTAAGATALQDALDEAGPPDPEEGAFGSEVATITTPTLVQWTDECYASVTVTAEKKR